MKEIVKNVLKEYNEIKLINDMEIEKLNNENLIIDNFLRDIKLIVDCYENKIKELEEKIFILDTLSRFQNYKMKKLESKYDLYDVK